MSISNHSDHTQELRQRKSTADNVVVQDQEDALLDNDENGQKEEDIIRIPSRSQSNSSEPGPLTRSKLMSLFIVLFSVFLDFLGMSLIQPILPFYAEKFGANSTQLGALYSSYAAMSLLASLFMGVGSDKFGRKPMVLFSLFGTMTGYLLTGLANSYGQLLGCRFITGFFGGSSPVAFAVIADLVPAADRSKWVSAVGGMLTVAFIVGPGLGSGLSVFGLRVPFFASSGVGTFGLIMAAIFMKESNPTIIRKRYLKEKNTNNNKNNDDTDNEIDKPDQVKTPETDSDLDVMDNIKIITGDDENVGTAVTIDSKIPIQFWIICIVSLLSGLATAVYTSMMALYLIDEFALDAVSVGYVTLATATIGTLANILFIVLSNKLGLYVTTIIGASYYGIALIVIPNVTELWGFLAVVAMGVGVGFGMAIPAYNSIAVSLSNVKTRGRISGLISAAGSGAQIIGPIIHGILYGIDNSYPFYLGAGSCFVGAVIISLMVCKWPQFRIPPKKKEPVFEDHADWVFKPDIIHRKDYMKLGKALGTMLTQKNYKWVNHFGPIMEHFDTMLPPLSIDSYASFIDDIRYLQEAAKDTRSEFDNVRYAIGDVAQIRG